MALYWVLGLPLPCFGECLFREPIDSEHYTSPMSEHQESEETSAEELAQFEQYIRFISCDPVKNRQRFYLLTWQPMLDGDTALVCSWGRLGTYGRSKTIFPSDHAQGQETLVRLIKRRLQRGYRVTAWH